MRKSIRTLKISLALVLIGLSLWATLLPPYFPSSSHAVINTRKIAINSRTDGMIGRLDVNSGSQVAKSQPVAVIELDQTTLIREIEQLQFLKTRLEAQITHAESELALRKKEMEKIASEFASRKTTTIAMLESEWKDLLEKSGIERKQHDILLEDQQRIGALLEKGIVTKAKWLELNKITLESEKRLQAVTSEAKRVESYLGLARAGLKLAESDSNNALTTELASMQHEVRDLQSEKAGLELKLEETTKLLETSQTHLSSSSQQVIGSPADGMIWSRPGVEGQVISSGQAIAHLADRCSIFVESFFHRHYEGGIQPGDHAFIQLQSGRLLLAGRVVEVKAQEHGTEDLYVINSVAPSSTMLRVMIKVDDGVLTTDQVGKLGKVVITSGKPGFINKTLVRLSLLLRYE